MASNDRKRAASDTTSDTEAPESKKQCHPAPSKTSNAGLSEDDAPMTGSSTIVQSSIMPTASDAQPDSTTPTVPSAAVTSTSGFFGPLPQELEDLIFEFAYQQDPAMKFMTASDWAGREEDKRRKSRTYVALPFPTHFLTLTMDHEWEYCTGGISKYAWQEPFTPVDFDTMLKDSPLLEMRGLKELKVESGTHYTFLSDDKTEEEKEMLELNTRELEKALRKSALQPKLSPPPETEKDQPLSLYSGSRVFWTPPDKNEPSPRGKKEAKRLERIQHAVGGEESTLTKEMCKDVKLELCEVQTTVGTEGDALKGKAFPFAALLELANWRRTICASESYVDPYKSLRDRLDWS
ncbi:hypothetical protein B0A48_07117 [Cryoendolithus antarcticus]|uniref:Uncharacterized protein n=1 Tax=Cryoendolithus antarcticus TaxID=1507870 RepID=A0A1V8T7T8_9PEZI|nr:hypothetical protein B0A48_07117 [Cryoendolithus antarcticus]